MQRVKKLIMILSILLIIITFIVIIIKQLYKKKLNEEADLNVITYERTFYIEQVNNSTDFYTVKNICNSYIESILYQSSEEIYNMLSPEYIKEFEITEDNISDKIVYSNYNIDQNENLSLDLIIKDMKYVRNNNSIYLFFVSGYVRDNIKHEKTDFTCMVEIDKNNNTFYITPENYMKKHNYINVKEGDSFNIDIEDIKSKGYYNKYDNIIITDQEIMEEYLENYKEAILYDTKEAYEMLDEEYKSARFGSYENFEQYVNKNIRQIISYTIDKYKVNTEDNYVRYILSDSEGNYYICKQYSIAKYFILLDNYTIDLPEFLDKYNSADVQGKVALNIQKIIQAINLQDYEYVYNKLSVGFKNNYFKNQEDFEKYISENLFNNNEVQYKSFEEEGGLYKYTINIIDTENRNNTVEKTIIMKLNEGTNFEMSFNIN